MFSHFYCLSYDFLLFSLFFKIFTYANRYQVQLCPTNSSQTCWTITGSRRRWRGGWARCSSPPRGTSSCTRQTWCSNMTRSYWPYLRSLLLIINYFYKNLLKHGHSFPMQTGEQIKKMFSNKHNLNFFLQLM